VDAWARRRDDTEGENLCAAAIAGRLSAILGIVARGLVLNGSTNAD
jgi:hypothetical protein